MKKISLDFSPTEVKSEGKSVIIEGYANKAIIDRGNDLIPGNAWKLEEFKTNPIIFFNHDRNCPIGKAIEVKSDENGLYCKIQISKSQAAPIPYVRDMISEGILRTFSVGFDPCNSESRREDGVNLISTANLLEISVVSIPMNQASIFDLSKALTTKSLKEIKDYHSACARVVSEKGCHMAEILHSSIAHAQSRVEGFDKIASLNRVAELSGLSMQMVLDILAGVVTPVPEEFIKAFSQVFLMATDMLRFIAGDEYQNYGAESVDRSEKKVEQDSEGENQQTAKSGNQETDGCDEEEGCHEEDKENAEDEKTVEQAEEQSEKSHIRDPLDSITDFLLHNIVTRKGFVDCKEIDFEVISFLQRNPEYRSRGKELLVKLDSKCKQADQGSEVSAAVSTPVAPQATEMDFGSPHLDLMKSQLALAGSLVSISKEILEAIRDLKNSGVATAQSSSDNNPKTDNPQSSPVLRSNDLDKVSKMVENFELRIKKLSKKSS
jgi:hypothetical protein